MALWIGRRQSVGVGVESTRGVGVTPTYWLNCLSFSFSDKPTRALSEATFGGIWGGDQAPVTVTHAEGEFDVELDDRSLGAILYALFGSLSTTGPTDTAVYTHTFSLSNTNQHKSLTIHTIDPIGQFAYEMSMIDSFELMVEPDAIVHYRVNFLSRASVDSANQTASWATLGKKFVGRNLQFKVAATTASLGAATVISLKSLTLRVEKNAELNYTLSTIQPEDIVNKRFSISGEITLNYEDRTWLNYVKDGSYKAVRISLIHEDTITGAASTKYEFTIDLSKVDFENFEPDFALDEVVTQTLTFNALYDAGGNNNVVNSCYLKNAIASY